MDIRIPQQSIVYLLICLSGIFLFLIFGIVPNQRFLKELDGKIAETRVQIEERKMLISTYQTLKQSTRRQNARVLPFPQKNGQNPAEVEKLTDTMKDLARRTKVEVVSIAPGLNSLEGNSKVLVLDLIVRGAFRSFRLFLIALAGLPFLDYIEELNFQQNPAGLELRVKFWVEHA